MVKEVFKEITVKCFCTAKVKLPVNYLATICPNCGCKVRRPDKGTKRKT